VFLELFDEVVGGKTGVVPFAAAKIVAGEELDVRSEIGGLDFGGERAGSDWFSGDRCLTPDQR
jgi:hypothetical protein